MKNYILIIVTFCNINCFCQYTGKTDSSNNLSYELHGAYKYPIKKEILNSANTLNDLISGYPSNWIDSYISVDILTNSSGKSIKKTGTSNFLSTEQKNSLSTVNLGEDVFINTKYQIKNAVTKKLEISRMNFSITVVPGIEAEFVDGNAAGIAYLKKEISANRIEFALKKLKITTIKFTVNEIGAVVNPIVLSSSTDINIDKLLLKIISTMPKWKPAHNANGVKVKQDFEFTVGNFGC